MGYYIGIATLICCNIVVVIGLSLLTGFTGIFSFGHAAFMALGAYTSAILTTRIGLPFALALIAAVAVSYTHLDVYKRQGGLAHLGAVAFQQELEGHAVGAGPFLAADQFHAGNDIGPLVVAAELDFAVIAAVKLQEVIGLHQHVVCLLYTSRCV